MADDGKPPAGGQGGMAARSHGLGRARRRRLGSRPQLTTDERPDGGIQVRADQACPCAPQAARTPRPTAPRCRRSSRSWRPSDIDGGRAPWPRRRWPAGWSTRWCSTWPPSGWRAEDRFAEALALLQRGHRRLPSDLGLRQALGLCLFRLQRFEAALPHFDALIAAAAGLRARPMPRAARPWRPWSGSTRRRPPSAAPTSCEPENLLAIAGLASIASRGGATPRPARFAERVLAGRARLSRRGDGAGPRRPGRARLRRRPRRGCAT